MEKNPGARPSSTGPAANAGGQAPQRRISAIVPAADRDWQRQLSEQLEKNAALQKECGRLREALAASEASPTWQPARQEGAAVDALKLHVAEYESQLQSFKAEAARLAAESSAAEQKMSESARREEELGEQLSALSAECDVLREALTERDSVIAENADTIRRLGQESGKSTRDAGELRAQLTRTADECAALRGALAERDSAAAESGDRIHRLELEIERLTQSEAPFRAETPGGTGTGAEPVEIAQAAVDTGAPKTSEPVGPLKLKLRVPRAQPPAKCDTPPADAVEIADEEYSEGAKGDLPGVEERATGSPRRIRAKMTEAPHTVGVDAAGMYAESDNDNLAVMRGQIRQILHKFEKDAADLAPYFGPEGFRR